MHSRALQKLTAYFVHDGDSRVVHSVDGKQDFVVGIILGKEAAEILFQVIVLSAKRFQDTDGSRVCEWRRRNGQVTARSDTGEHAVNPRANQQQNE
jgi:hypothetical protein